MKEKEQKCVLVLGMHRSGSSLLAGVLNILGVDFGNKVLSPGEDNPKGFFEHSDIVNLNIDFLNSFNIEMHGIKTELPSNWTTDSRVENFKKKLSEIIKRDFCSDHENKLFGIKDPRISLLLPVYIEVLEDLNIRPVFAISERSEIEIAYSLEKRNHFALSLGIKAARYFKRNIDFYTNGKTFTKVDFSNLVNDRKNTIEKIKRDLSINIKSYEESKESIDSFIDPSLKHHNLSKEDFVLDLVKKLEDRNYVYIQNNKDGTPSSLNIQKILIDYEKDRIWWQDRLDQSENILEKKDALIQQLNNELLQKERFVIESETEKKEIEGKNEALEGKNEALEGKNEALEGKNELLEDDVNKMGSHINHLQNLIDERDRQIDSLNTSLTNIERSFTWKVVKAWDIFISFIFPKGSFFHNKYKNLIRFNQDFLNGWLPGKIVKEIKKKEKRIDAGYFWEKFDKEHKDTDILFVNHDEKRTGAPRILFDVAEESKKTKKVAMISMGKGAMGIDFEKEFGPVVYPDDIYPTHTEEEKIKAVLEHVKPKVLYANSISTYKYAEIAKNLGIKTIFHIHELDIAFKIVFNSEQRERFKDFSDKFIAVSQPVYDLLVHKLNCPADKVELINAFVSRDKILEWSKQIDPDFVNKEIKKEEARRCTLRSGSDHHTEEETPCRP